MIEFVTTTEEVGENREIESNCNSILFIRKPSTAEFWVNGYPLSEGETYSVAGLIGEVDVTKYRIVFDSTSGLPKSAYILRKEYLKK